MTPPRNWDGLVSLQEASQGLLVFKANFITFPDHIISFFSLQNILFSSISFVKIETFVNIGMGLCGRSDAEKPYELASVWFNSVVFQILKNT